MAFFPDVSRGQAFQPSALLSNNVRHMVNAMNGFQSAGILGASGGIVRIQVYNNTSAAILAGTAVGFSEKGSICDDAIPCESLKDAAKPWGVVAMTLAAKQMGDCIISGPATVSVSGSGNYAQPNPVSPATFVRGAIGAPILFANNGKAVINLGAATQDNYDGPFAISYDADGKKVKVAAGYFSGNGEWKDVAGVTLNPENGIICVCSSLGSDGTWSSPEVKFAKPGAFNYPIGNCKKNGESVELCCFRVPVVILLSAGECGD